MDSGRGGSGGGHSSGASGRTGGGAGTGAPSFVTTGETAAAAAAAGGGAAVAALAFERWSGWAAAAGIGNLHSAKTPSSSFTTAVAVEGAGTESGPSCFVAVSNWSTATAVTGKATAAGRRPDGTSAENETGRRERSSHPRLSRSSFHRLARDACTTSAGSPTLVVVGDGDGADEAAAAAAASRASWMGAPPHISPVIASIFSRISRQRRHKIPTLAEGSGEPFLARARSDAKSAAKNSSLRSGRSTLTSRHQHQFITHQTHKLD